MAIHTLSKERIDELVEQLKQKKKLYDELKKRTIQEMWLTDLAEIEKLL
jgi:hypothetical protein